jgi:hypothetical protein
MVAALMDVSLARSPRLLLPLMESLLFPLMLVLLLWEMRGSRRPSLLP